MGVSISLLSQNHEGLSYTSVEVYRSVDQPAAKLARAKEGTKVYNLTKITQLVVIIYRIVALVKMLMGLIPL